MATTPPPPYSSPIISPSAPPDSSADFPLDSLHNPPPMWAEACVAIGNVWIALQEERHLIRRRILDKLQDLKETKDQAKGKKAGKQPIKIEGNDDSIENQKKDNTQGESRFVYKAANLLDLPEDETVLKLGWERADFYESANAASGEARGPDGGRESDMDVEVGAEHIEEIDAELGHAGNETRGSDRSWLKGLLRRHPRRYRFC